jgi:hypothetical protein
MGIISAMFTGILVAKMAAVLPVLDHVPCWASVKPTITVKSRASGFSTSVELIK